MAIVTRAHREAAVKRFVGDDPRVIELIAFFLSGEADEHPLIQAEANRRNGSEKEEKK